MNAIELRNTVLNIVNTSDEKFLVLVKKLYDSYRLEKEDDFFEGLPIEIQELLEQSREQIKNGKVRTHYEVMNELRKKYKIS